MKKKRYSEEQIVRILRETDRDTLPAVAKRHGVSDASIYAWRKRFGAMGNEEASVALMQRSVIKVFSELILKNLFMDRA